MTIKFMTEFSEEIKEYLLQGDFEKALASIDISLAHNPDSEILLFISGLI